MDLFVLHLPLCLTYQPLEFSAHHEFYQKIMLLLISLIQFLILYSLTLIHSILTDSFVTLDPHHPLLHIFHNKISCFTQFDSSYSYLLSLTFYATSDMLYVFSLVSFLLEPNLSLII